MKKVISNKLREILESQQRQKRRINHKTTPLDNLIFEEDEESCLAVEDENFDAALKSDTKEILLRALEKLSSRQQELCRLLKDEGLSLNQVSKRLNIPRATLHDEILRIRDVFLREGLKDYL